MAEKIKVYLDDERRAPDGWVQVRWPEEAIELLKQGNVSEISLDHDLGDDDHGTGYDVVLWVEEAVVTRGFVPPKMAVHSANSSARMKMEAGIRSIEERGKGQVALASLRTRLAPGADQSDRGEFVDYSLDDLIAELDRET